jgi:outer membrane immunogenic protein
MKVVVIGVAIAALVGGSAIAADMPLKAPAPAALVSWTGCYIGGNGGGAFNKSIALSDSVSFPGRFVDFGKGSDNSGGPFGGGQVGCDYQFGQFVLGARATFDWADIGVSHTLVPAVPTAFERTHLRDFATATGRLGFTVVPQVLLYVDGGGVWARERTRIAFFPNISSESASYDLSGWTIGGGGEVLLGSNWSFFAEYNHFDFGTKRVCFTQAPGTVFSGIPCGVGGGNAMDIRQRVDLVMVGLNFRWAGPGARY